MSMSSSLPSALIFQKESLSFNPKLTDLDRLAGQRASGIHLSLPLPAVLKEPIRVPGSYPSSVCAGWGAEVRS